MLTLKLQKQFITTLPVRHVLTLNIKLMSSAKNQSLSKSDQKVTIAKIKEAPIPLLHKEWELFVTKPIILMKGIDVYPIKYGFLIHSNRSVFSFKVNF